ncbi:hypothetical protein LPB86_17790 [Pedobacter sp. MC2016-14]|uniref:hypothetical protein n=1 Tax=Pedobacter sp. MC2016-14 TaxID=2897327 RepID=UPI001E2863F9|nr:hypothetical protein [Pedobacter sp. MC2016-14]MCD0490097.1 hypothetical protein [Pedobacter sp. MC2016-14]
MKTYKINNTAGLSLEQLYTSLSAGGCIISYGYCISAIAFTYRLMSAPYYIKAGEKPSTYRKKYNRLSRIFGWWGIPWGPIYTFDMLRMNREKRGGGINITEDVLSVLRDKYANRDLNEIFAEDILITYGEDEQQESELSPVKLNSGLIK